MTEEQMRNKLGVGVLLLSVLVLSLAGGIYWFNFLPFEKVQAQQALIQKQGQHRSILYWKHPKDSSRFSRQPRKSDDGSDYLPVYSDEEPDFDQEPVKTAKKGATGKILYYRNPMGLPDVSPVPKKDWMGMDYIPVYENEEEGGTVTVSIDRIQRSGVRVVEARKANLSRSVRAPGIAKPDERTLYAVTLRADAFIEKLYVNETGRQVRAGEPLFRLYSPQMVSVQVDYRTAAKAASRNAWDESGAVQRLKNLGLPESVLAELRSSFSPQTTFDWPAPVSGVVMRKNVIDGQMVRAGDELYRIADLANIWVIADVSELDVGHVILGAPAKVNFKAIPAKTYEGRVTFILHEIDSATRTAKVRIEIKNPDYRIKHEMYADIEIETGTGELHRLVVPNSALIDSGNRQVVFVDKGEGRFEPRNVKVGLRGEEYVEIQEGLVAGEKVVVVATFLIDAESNLKAALRVFAGEKTVEGKQ
jgi:membrane fusion protein, copper/silver efflux system